MKKQKSHRIQHMLIALVLSLSLPTFINGNQVCDSGGRGYMNMPYGDGVEILYDYDDDPYTPIAYEYSSPHYRDHMNWTHNQSRSFSDFGRKFDNSDNFTSGISSYQGTSTGPGPNGGYPGTPRGIYHTNYVNRSIYPNNYNR